MTASLLRLAFHAPHPGVGHDLKSLVETACSSLGEDPSPATRRQVLNAAALLDAFGLHDEAERLHVLLQGPSLRVAA